MSEPPESRALVRDAAVVTGLFLVAASVVGLVLPAVVEPALATRTAEGVGVDEVQLAHQFDAVGWYVVLASIAGLVLGFASAAWRRTDEVVTVLVVLGAALVAAWWSAQLAQWAGPADPSRVLADADVGDQAPSRIEVDAVAALFVWPFAALVGTLGWLWGPGGRRTTAGRDSEPASPATGPGDRADVVQ